MAELGRLWDLTEALAQAEFAWRDEISRLHRAGVRVEEIAKAANVPRGTIRGMLG